MVWWIAIVAYAILFTIIHVFTRKSSLVPFEKYLMSSWESVETEDSASDRAELYRALSELQNVSTPWYERAFSTVGVIAFISMSIAVGIQTVGSSLQQAKADRLDAEIEELREEREVAERFVADVSESVASGAMAGGMLTPLERKILKYRLDRLSSKNVPTPSDIREIFALALTLRQFSTAIEVLEQNKNMLNQTEPADRLSLAEYYFLVGSHHAASKLSDPLWRERSSLAKPLLLRLLILRGSLGHSIDELVVCLMLFLSYRAQLGLGRLSPGSFRP